MQRYKKDTDGNDIKTTEHLDLVGAKHIQLSNSGGFKRKWGFSYLSRFLLYLAYTSLVCAVHYCPHLVTVLLEVSMIRGSPTSALGSGSLWPR